MKILSFTKFIGFVMLLGLASPAIASNHPWVVTTKNEEVRATELKNRLEGIKALDKGALSTSEKKALRMEVKEIKKELATMSGGVYLSVGAAILIVLLLILLL